MRVFFQNNANMQDDFIPATDIAIIVADVIYSRFGFCIDGMSGHLILYKHSNQNRGYSEWLVSIHSEEHTAHSTGNELFHIEVDPITGRVRNLAMNTPETPFAG
jgi:hypothetical protein